MRDNYPYGLFAVPKKEIVRIHASSGTTGKMKVVGYTKGDLDIWGETMARSLVMAGASSDSVIHISYGYGLFTGGLGAHIGSERLGATTVPAGTGNTRRQIMLLRDLQAEILCCTPSYALYLAEEMTKEGVKASDLCLTAGVFGAEPWTEEMRREIEKKLGLRAHDIYGLSEIMGPSVSMECAEQNGLHVQEDHFLPEIIDPDTLEPLPFGQEGELVFTTLTKEGMPLIRYRTRDLCTLSVTPCKCGRTGARMGRVRGRSDDMLIIRGVNVFPSQIESVLLSVNGTAPHYMIEVDRIDMQDRLIVKIEMSPELFTSATESAEEIKRRIEKDLSHILGLRAHVLLTEPRTLERSEGKAKRVIDHRKI
jgi:phenylacetate-CoA ligase